MEAIMGLTETLASMAQSQADANKDKELLPIRIENWQNRVKDLYKTVLGMLREADPQGRITSRDRAFQANANNPYGSYKSTVLQLDVLGTNIELKPFESTHDEEVNTVHMSKVGRGERIRFLYDKDRWKIAIQPANEHDEWMAGRRPVWEYEEFSSQSFTAALDYLLNTGAKA